MKPRHLLLLGLLLGALAVLATACDTQADERKAQAQRELFERYQESGPAQGEELSGAELGKSLVSTNGCVSCHTTTGEASVGPTWEGLFGRTTTLADGSTVTADEAYIHESIVDPSAKVVDGFPDGVMPKGFGDSLTEEQISAIIEYIKTLE